MKLLLQETCAKVSKRKRKKLTKTEYTNLQKRFRNILTRGEKELPPVPPRQNGKQGRIAKSDAVWCKNRIFSFKLLHDSRN